MKLLMAVSADGYLCMGPKDDMTWTGPEDKKIFRLLSRSTDCPLLAGRNTAELMPKLPVPVHALTRPHLTLGKADSLYPEAWLIGGPTVAREAILQGYVRKIYFCHSPIEIYDGVKLSRVMEAIPTWKPTTKIIREVITFEQVKVEILRW